MRNVPDIKAELTQRAREAQRGGGNTYDSDSEDDMPGGAQRVQCAQQ